MRQIDRVGIRTDSLISSNIMEICSGSESILIFADTGVSYEAVSELLQKFTLYAGVKYILTGGRFSEEVHDLIDDKLLQGEDYKLSALTAWSQEPFLETL